MVPVVRERGLVYIVGVVLRIHGRTARRYFATALKLNRCRGFTTRTPVSSAEAFQQLLHLWCARERRGPLISTRQWRRHKLISYSYKEKTQGDMIPRVQKGCVEGAP